MLTIYVGVFLLAAATLGLEITLMRVFALAQGYHFGFIAISVALLGLGASGTALSLWPALRRHPRRVAALSAVGCAVCTLGGYLVANYLPLNIYLIAWQPTQFLFLAIYYLALALPFFCAGLCTGLVLAAYPQASHRVYAANLLGSACGCGLAPLILTWVGAAGTVAACAATASLAMVVFLWERPRRLGALAVGLVLTLACTVLAVVRPAWLEVRLSSYKELPQVLQSQGAVLVSQRWNAQARVDVVASPSLHAAPGMSLGCQAAIPPQQALFVDGGNPTPRLMTDPVTMRAWAGCLPLALPFTLRPDSKTLILEPGGNLDLLVAQSFNADQVTVVEPNGLLVDAAGGYPGAEVVVESGRVFLRRTSERFDVIDLALSGSRNQVTAGAFSLSEEYRYTVEAFQDALARLDNGGLFVISSWLQSPPSEELRLWALAVTALEKSGAADVRSRLVAIRTWSTIVILVRNGAFTAEELATVRTFSAARQFDLVYLPDMQPEEANRYNVYPSDPYPSAFRELIEAPDRQAFYAAQEYDIRPPSDDHPFLYHLFTWRQVPTLLSELGRTWKPFGGSGYLVLLALFAVAIVSGLVLVLLPVARGVGRGMRGRGRTAAYFALLGVGFLAVEIPLLQRFILFLGNPTIAFAVVVSSLLFFSGIGSLLARRYTPRWVLAALVLVIMLTTLGLGPLFRMLLGTNLWVRVVATILCLAPLGLLMGMPFPLGLARIEQESAHLTPWAWAVNGSASVVVSVGAALGSLSVGFTAIFAVGVIAYALAALLSLGYRKSSSVTTASEEAQT
ncbi:MAG: spermidine synthase family protein [Anaerolineae bacterium]